MKEAKAELFDLIGQVDFICITTNGSLRSSGSAVMGRGCALQAKTRWRGLDEYLGQLLGIYGNVPLFLGSIDPYKSWKKDFTFTQGETGLYSFPTKHRWDQKSDIELIKQSAWFLKNALQAWPFGRIILPRPGCANGGLKWEDVKPQIELILDDRFTLITNEN